jgi:hypothetical protein
MKEKQHVPRATGRRIPSFQVARLADRETQAARNLLSRLCPGPACPCGMQESAASCARALGITTPAEARFA